MNYSVIIENRISIGFALGWSYYGRNENYDYGELTLYIGLISLKIRYERI
jgi:hypothetical protein